MTDRTHRELYPEQYGHSLVGKTVRVEGAGGKAFTSEQAFEASEDGEPIYVSPEFQQQLCHEHDTLWGDYLLDCEEGCLDPHDAAVLLGWLGY